MAQEHNKFKFLCENVTNRLRTRGILVGDYVTFNKEAFKSDWMRSQAQSVLQKIGQYTNGEKPTLLKVFMIKNDKSSTYGPLGASEDLDFNPVTADVGIEPSPGVCVDVMTVPLHLLEIVSIGETNMLPKAYVDALEKEGRKHLKRTNKPNLDKQQKLEGIG